MDADAQTEAVENGHDGQHLHAGNGIVTGGGDGLQPQRVEVAVRKPDALGGAGGAAGIEDGGTVLRMRVYLRKDGDGFCHLQHLCPERVTILGQFVTATPGMGVKKIQRKGKFVGDFCHQNRNGILQVRQGGCHLVIKLVQGQNRFGSGEV